MISKKYQYQFIIDILDQLASNTYICYIIKLLINYLDFRGESQFNFLPKFILNSTAGEEGESLESLESWND